MLLLLYWMLECVVTGLLDASGVLLLVYWMLAVRVRVCVCKCVLCVTETVFQLCSRFNEHTHRHCLVLCISEANVLVL